MRMPEKRFPVDIPVDFFDRARVRKNNRACKKLSIYTYRVCLQLNCELNCVYTYLPIWCHRQSSSSC